MKIGTRITLSFVILGIFIIIASFLGVRSSETQLKEMGGFHSAALYSIQSLNSRSTEAVEESFAYVVSGDAHEKEEVEHSHQVALDTINRSEKIIYGVGFLSLMLAVGRGIFVSKNISTRLLKLHQAATDIGKGELTTKIEITSRDEIGSLADSFNKMANDLQKTTVSRDTVEEINHALIAKIKEKDEAEKKVHLERQNLYNILDSLPMAFHLQASDYTVPFANKVFRELFGDPEKRMCHDLMHNRSQPCEVCRPFKVFDHGKNEVSVWESLGGRTYITVCTPFTDVDGSPLVMEMALDITEQESAKKQAIQVQEELELSNKYLQASENRIRLITDSLPVFISYIDREHYFRFNNKSYEDWFGKSRNDVQGKHVKELMGEPAYELIKPYFDRALSGERVVHETLMPYKYGPSRHVQAEFIPDVDEHGKVKGIFALVSDITKSKQAEKELIQAKEAAEKSSHAKSDFLTCMSHELRTPLNAILGFGQLLIMDQENSLSSIQKSNSKHILKAGQHLLELINDVLDLSQVESGHVSISIEEIHLNSLIFEMAAQTV